MPFAGNNLTGAVGLRTDGEILVLGLSLTRTFASRWGVGLEVGVAPEWAVQLGVIWDP